MKKILLFLSFILMSIGMWGAAATMTAGSNASTATVNGHAAIKVGTNKNSGNMTITVPATSIKLTVYIAAWNGTSPTVSITPNTNITPTSVSLISDDGIANNSPFTLSGTESTYKFEFTLSNITTPTTFTLSANKRFVVWGAEYETPSKYTISFVNNLGKSPNNITQATFGSAISLPTTIAICNKCYEENWTFEGWTPSKTNYSTVYKTTFTPTQDTVLYALYTRKGIKDIKVVEYKRVTSTQTDWSGDYLIAYIDGDKNISIADGRIGGGTDPTISNGIGSVGTKINPLTNATGDSIILTSFGDLYNVSILSLTDTTYLLQTKDEQYNYHSTNSTGGHMKATTNLTIVEKYPIKIVYNNEYSIGLFLLGEATGQELQYNSSSNGYFRFYKNGTQNSICLFKKQTSIYPSPIEHTIAPECDSSFIATWNKDKIFIDKGLSYNLDGKTVTIKDIDTDETLSNSITYDSSTDLYQVNTNLTGKECDKINIFITDNNTDSIYLIYKVPFIVDADAYTTSMDDENCDVVVLPGKKLTVSGTDSEHRDVKLYAGAHLSIPEGTTYTVNSLSLRRDNLTTSTLGLTGTISANKLYFDLYVDASDWYFVCLPNTFNLSTLKYVNGRIPQYKKNFWVRWYDGFGRALTQSGAWTNVDHDREFSRGEGFIFGLNDDLKKKEFRFELPISTLTEETSDKNVGDLHAWGGDMPELRPNHKGWNLIGNPFMNSVVTDLASPINIGKLVKDTLSGQWNGQWNGQWILDNESVTKTWRYGVFPSKDPEDADAGGYKSVVLDDIELNPFTSFFVQIGGEDPEENQAIIFNKEDRGPLMAPKRHVEYDPDEELFLRIKVGNRKTGCFISNKFTDEYEPGDDLESRYPIYQSIGGYKLLYSAINDSIIEHGVQVTAPQGTLYLDPKVDISKFEHIYANYNGNWYDLKNGETAEINGTFILQAKRKVNDNTPTDIGELKPGSGIYKFTDGNNIYVNRNNIIYSIIGNKVR